MEVCTEAKGVREEPTVILPMWKEQGTKCKKQTKNPLTFHLTPQPGFLMHSQSTLSSPWRSLDHTNVIVK